MTEMADAAASQSTGLDPQYVSIVEPGARLRYSGAADVRRDDRRRVRTDRSARAEGARAVSTGDVRLRQWRRRHGYGARFHPEPELDAGAVCCCGLRCRVA